MSALALSAAVLDATPESVSGLTSLAFGALAPDPDPDSDRLEPDPPAAGATTAHGPENSRLISDEHELRATHARSRASLRRRSMVEASWWLTSCAVVGVGSVMRDAVGARLGGADAADDEGSAGEGSGSARESCGGALVGGEGSGAVGGGIGMASVVEFVGEGRGGGTVVATGEGAGKGGGGGASAKTRTCSSDGQSRSHTPGTGVDGRGALPARRSIWCVGRKREGGAVSAGMGSHGGHERGG